MPVPRKHASTMRFVCAGCRTPLVVADSQVGVSGPCPNCDTWIDASQFTSQYTPAKVLEASVPSSGSSRKRRSQNLDGGRGNIRADGYLDHNHNERRELFGTLRVLAVSLAVLAVILFVALFMKQWGMK
jgi:hypothetical protein